MNNTINILMTGAGAPGGPGIIKCLTQDSLINLTTCDADEEASGKFISKNFFQCPKASDSNFVNYILEKCIELKINLVFPLVTKELFLFSQHKNLFESNGIKVLVSDFEALSIANDKSKLHELLRENNFEVSDFVVVESSEELESTLDYFINKYGKVCIKPSISNGSRGVRIIDDSIDEFDLLFNFKPNSLYTNKQHLLSIVKGRNFPQLLVSEVLPGEEITIDTLFDDGNVKLIVPRSRKKMNSGISVAGKIIQIPEIELHIKKIASILKLNGPIGFQYKKDISGNYKLLEINPRIQGTSVSLLGANVNLPLLSIYNELKLNFEIPTINWGVNFVRFYDEIFF